MQTIQDRFEDFHRDNPVVYELLVRFARELHNSGRKRSGIRMVWERMRWEIAVNTVDRSSKFKLNDHYTSRYARLIMAREWDLRDFFEVREIRAA